ncbi:phospholipase D family protein [Clostridium sp. MCC353]|uniref:phospholipase D-like domain-containing protein n=1 Tax=Clostridium sp. MCC353 TaxID=2592646 RepID=UPI001C021449|nr:phospholipase D family protein [Clostridium sp. MCC353]MBT9777113.1 phospholipase D family protein [Clostridium sp. MCC353]
MKKFRLKHLFLVLAVFLIYVVLGCLIPFMHPKQVGDSFRASFDTDAFYNDSGTDSADRAAVVESSMDALNVRIQMIHQAKERIVLSTFDIRAGQSCDDIFSSILEAADRGVKVRILVDGMYGSLHMNQEPIFYALGAHPDIEIKFYNTPNPLKPWTIHGRMHDKYLLIDDKLLLMGGRNTFDYFLGEYNMENLSYDRDVLIYNTGHGQEDAKSSAVWQTDRYFQDMWNSEYCETVFEQPSKSMKKKMPDAESELRAHYLELSARSPELTVPDFDYTDSTIPIKKATLIWNPTHIMGKEPWIWYQLEELMKQAEHRVYLHTPYAVFSQDMYDGMAETAGSVPDFKMMINSVAVGDNFMASSDYIFNKNKILDTGVTVYEYNGSHSSHGKSMLIDHDISLIGSYNLDMRSTYVDTETMLVIHGEEFNKQLESHILALEEDAVRIEPDGTVAADDAGKAKNVSRVKQLLFFVTSRLFQLFHYLI